MKYTFSDIYQFYTKKIKKLNESIQKKSSDKEKQLNESPTASFPNIKNDIFHIKVPSDEMLREGDKLGITIEVNTNFLYDVDEPINPKLLLDRYVTKEKLQTIQFSAKRLGSDFEITHMLYNITGNDENAYTKTDFILNTVSTERKRLKKTGDNIKESKLRYLPFQLVISADFPILIPETKNFGNDLHIIANAFLSKLTEIIRMNDDQNKLREHYGLDIKGRVSGVKYIKTYTPTRKVSPVASPLTRGGSKSRAGSSL